MESAMATPPEITVASVSGFLSNRKDVARLISVWPDTRWDQTHPPFGLKRFSASASQNYS